MKNKLIVVCLFMGQFQFIAAQSNVDKEINGQVTSSVGLPIEGATVINTSNKVIVISDQYGHFSIFAKAGDILSFSTVNYEFLRKFINSNEIKVGNIFVSLTPKSIELNEVIVNKHSDITAENLGIIPNDQVKLTTAERRLQTAGDFKPIHLLGLLGGSLAVDPILNAINGRTKRLKKEVAVEKKEFLMAKLVNLFDDKYYIETLKIPEDLITGFQYYCIEDPHFVKSLNDKNKTMSMFLIVGLASEFNKNQEK